MVESHTILGERNWKNDKFVQYFVKMRAVENPNQSILIMFSWFLLFLTFFIFEIIPWSDIWHTDDLIWIPLPRPWVTKHSGGTFCLKNELTRLQSSLFLCYFSYSVCYCLHFFIIILKTFSVVPHSVFEVGPRYPLILHRFWHVSGEDTCTLVFILERIDMANIYFLLR